MLFIVSIDPASSDTALKHINTTQSLQYFLDLHHKFASERKAYSSPTGVFSLLCNSSSNSAVVIIYYGFSNASLKYKKLFNHCFKIGVREHWIMLKVILDRERCLLKIMIRHFSLFRFSANAYRLNESDAPLPKIPVHPIGYEDAYHFLRWGRN